MGNIYLWFWENLPKNFVGLSPMDDVTNAVYRKIQTDIIKPDLLMTEFTSVEGLSHNAFRLLDDFSYDEQERPICAQVFGYDLKAFYKASIIICALGFDGIDINMGCPMKAVSRHGAGAALIQNPHHAKKIIFTVQEAINDFVRGKRKISDLDISDKMKKEVIRRRSLLPKKYTQYKQIPISVKTRIGYSRESVEEWIGMLLDCEIANISVHGRTLKQMYTGNASWDAITKAVKIANKTPTRITGNGDVSSLKEAKSKCEQTGVDGVLIGRAALGNPWIFHPTHNTPTPEERFQTLLKHAHFYTKKYPDAPFSPMRKFLWWYIKWLDGAKYIRGALMQVHSSNDVEKIYETWKKNMCVNNRNE